MNEYDIKHPLRGQDYENVKVMKQPFQEKILQVTADEKSYLNYKRDRRQTLDMSEMRSEEHIKKELEKEQKQRIIMKYRLFGRDGVTKHELHKLKHHWGIIPKLHPDQVRTIAVKQKKRKIVQKTNKDGVTFDYSTSVSGSESECYQPTPDVDPFIYNDESNTDLSIKNLNKGFELRPLPYEIYGREASNASKMKYPEFEKNK